MSNSRSELSGLQNDLYYDKKYCKIVEIFNKWAIQSALGQNKTNALALSRNKLCIINVLLNMFIYLHSALCVNKNVTPHTRIQTHTERIAFLHSNTHTHSPKQYYQHFHLANIGIFQKSKPIDNLLQNYKKSIPNFFALISNWAFNMHPVATVRIPQSHISIGPHEY